MHSQTIEGIEVSVIVEGQEFDFLIKHNKLQYISTVRELAIYIAPNKLIVLYNLEIKEFYIADNIKNPTKRYVCIWDDIIYCLKNGIDLLQITIDRFYIKE